VPHEPGDVVDGRPLLENGAEPIGQVPARHGDAMRGDVASGVAIPNRQCLLKNLLHLPRQARPRIVGAQLAAALQQMVQTCLVRGLGEPSIGSPPIVDQDAGETGPPADSPLPQSRGPRGSHTPSWWG
jgi:hypothetical protein